MLTDVELRFRDRLTGTRLASDPDRLLGVDVSLTEAGGVDTIKGTLAASYEAAGPPLGALVETIVLSDPIPGGRSEPYPRWRGILSAPEEQISDAENKTVLAYGFAEDMQRVPVSGTLEIGGGGDIAGLASQVLQIYTRERPWLAYEADIEIVGVERQLITLDNSDCRAAMDAIAAQAPGLAVWGWRVNPATGANQFVFKSRSSAVGNRFAVGQNVKVYNRPLELSKVFNAWRFTGADSDYPNILGVVTGNASFEKAEARGATTGRNLINSPDDNDRNNWSLFGGASYKAGSLSEGPTYQGSSMTLLDNPGEGKYQDRTAIGSQLPAVGSPLTISVFSRLEHGTDTRVGEARLYWLDSSNAFISGGTPDATAALTPSTAGLWPETKFAAIRPAGAVGFRIEVIAQGGTGGLLIGFVAAYDYSALYPVGWDLTPFGTAKFLVGDPRFPDAWPGNTATPHGDGGRTCLRIKGTFSDADGQDGHLEAKGRATGPCSGNQTVKFIVRCKLTPGFTGPSGKMLLEVHGFKGSASSRVTYSKTTIAAGAVGTNWTEIVATVTLDSAATLVTAFVTFRGNTDILIDCVQLRDAAAGTEYISAAAWERRVFAEDVATVGSAAYQSASVYDRRETYVNNPSIKAWDADAIAWAKAYSEANAVPPSRARLQLIHEAAQFLDPLDGTKVRIVGVQRSIPDDYAARASYKWGPALAVDAELGGEAPSLARLIAGGGTKDVTRAAIASAGGGGASVSAGSTSGYILTTLDTRLPDPSAEPDGEVMTTAGGVSVWAAPTMRITGVDATGAAVTLIGPELKLDGMIITQDPITKVITAKPGGID